MSDILVNAVNAIIRDYYEKHLSLRVDFLRQVQSGGPQSSQEQLNSIAARYDDLLKTFNNLIELIPNLTQPVSFIPVQSSPVQSIIATNPAGQHQLPNGSVATLTVPQHSLNQAISQAGQHHTITIIQPEQTVKTPARKAPPRKPVRKRPKPGPQAKGEQQSESNQLKSEPQVIHAELLNNHLLIRGNNAQESSGLLDEDRGAAELWVTAPHEPRTKGSSVTAEQRRDVYAFFLKFRTKHSLRWIHSYVDRKYKYSMRGFRDFLARAHKDETLSSTAPLDLSGLIHIPDPQQQQQAIQISLNGPNGPFIVSLPHQSNSTTLNAQNVSQHTTSISTMPPTHSTGAVIIPAPQPAPSVQQQPPTTTGTTTPPSSYRTIPAEVERAIVQAVTSTASFQVSSITKQFGVSASSVYNILRRNGLKISSKSSPTKSTSVTTTAMCNGSNSNSTNEVDMAANL